MSHFDKSKKKSKSAKVIPLPDQSEEMTSKKTKGDAPKPKH